MNIVKNIYNPLTKLVRRIKELMKRLEAYISLTLVAIPVGFALLALAITLTSTLEASIPIGIVGLVLVGYAGYRYQQALNKLKDMEKEEYKPLINKLDEVIREIQNLKGKK